MKLLTALLFSAVVASAQTMSGTAILIMWDNDEATIGADSRATASVSGAHDDSFCKIATFGNNFVFTFSGIATDDSHQWSVYSIAENSWRKEKDRHANASDLVHAVAEQWNVQMKKIYFDGALLQGHGDAPGLAQPVFGATDSAGNIAFTAEDVMFNPELFHTKGKIEISIQNSQDLHSGNRLILGRTAIIEEYLQLKSNRARNDAAEFRATTSKLSVSAWRAALVTHLISRAVQLDPHKEELALPVDVVQLRAVSGIHYRAMKPNCKQASGPKVTSKPSRDRSEQIVAGG